MRSERIAVTARCDRQRQRLDWRWCVVWIQDPGTGPARHGPARQVRVHLDDALRHYSKAEELYVESRTALSALN